MSNLSNIGFSVETEEDFRLLLETAYDKSEKIMASNGWYMLYSDGSGAELWVQFDRRNRCIGANPHFNGKSNRIVCLTAPVDRTDSKLDGAYHAWADPEEPGNPETGAYPFVFDVPDYKSLGKFEMPATVDMQLTAFAHEFDCYDSEQDYIDGQKTEMKFATQSFIPSGLFSPDKDEENPNPPESLGMFSGLIKEWELKTNELTNENFYWLFIDTLGGEVDVVVDHRFLEKEPKVNGIVQGQFWLSGRIIDPPAFKPEKRGFFGKIFNN